MHRLTLVLFAACSACSFADAVVPAPTVPTSTEATDAHRADAEPVLERLRQARPRDRAALKVAIGNLSVSCPYTRASLQLPLVLEQVVSSLAAEDLAPHARAPWTELQRGLKAHVALLDAMGVDLRLPAAGDHLLWATEGRAIVDRTTLAASPDPIGDTMQLIARNDAIVEAMDDATRASIERDSGTVYAVIQPMTTTMYHLTARWHEALRTLAPSVQDPTDRARLERLIRVLDEHEKQGC